MTKFVASFNNSCMMAKASYQLLNILVERIYKYVEEVI